jgi:hypothetical protein
MVTVRLKDSSVQHLGVQILLAVFVAAGFTMFFFGTAIGAQTPAPVNAPAREAAAPAPARGAAPATSRRVEANMLQLMRGIKWQARPCATG